MIIDKLTKFILQASSDQLDYVRVNEVPVSSWLLKQKRKFFLTVPQVQI